MEGWKGGSGKSPADVGRYLGGLDVGPLGPSPDLIYTLSCCNSLSGYDSIRKVQNTVRKIDVSTV